MSSKVLPLECVDPGAHSSKAYEPPCIEQVLQPEDLEREVAYAGVTGSFD